MLALVIDEFAANRVYLLDSRASHKSRLLVLATNRGASLDELPLGAHRNDCR
jgi:hypothetical protein